MNIHDLSQIATFLDKTMEGNAEKLPISLRVQVDRGRSTANREHKSILTLHRKWTSELRYDQGCSEGEEGPEYFAEDGVLVFHAELPMIHCRFSHGGYIYGRSWAGK